MTPEAFRESLIPPVEPACSHDENDVLVGDVVSFSPEEYGLATHVIIGCPQDIGVQRNHGRTGAAKAPDIIRQCLYRLKPPAQSSQARILDLGNVVQSNHLHIMHEALYQAVNHALADGKIVIVLGGGNDISFPDAKAVHDIHPDYAAINMDAHLDMRKSDIIHSGTPYRNLIDGNHLRPEKFYEVGIQPWANSASYMSDARNMGVNLHTLTEIQAMGTTPFFDSLFDKLENVPLFVGLDMDSVRASDAPGVSAPSPVGFTADDILTFAARCRSYGKTALFEITEVNPEVDLDDHTSRLAALTLYTFIYGKR